MLTLRCTQKLLERLGVPRDAASDAAPDNALGDWYANLVRIGHDQLVVAMSERTFLTVLLPARGIRESIARDLPRMVGTLLRELEVPDEAVEREVAAMGPMAFARTASRSVVASLNERVHLVEHLWRGGSSPMEIMGILTRDPIMTGPAQADHFPSRAVRRLLGPDPRGPLPEAVARLHIALRDLAPPVWRRLVVPATITLPKLHDALQLAMGWEDRHLHEFDFGGARYGMPDEDMLDKGLKDEDRVRLDDVLRATGVERFTYTYDFGDHWLHDVRVEAVGANTEGVRGVVCVDGANRCPPEDVGGTPGYLEIIQHLRDPAHEAHRDAVAWAGEPFDAAAFDKEVVNARLRWKFER